MKKVLSWLLVLSVFGMCIYGLGEEKMRALFASASVFSAYTVMPGLQQKTEHAQINLAVNSETPAQSVVEPPKLPQNVSSESKPASSTPAAAANAKGKILTKFLSPYTANLQYDKIYINNKTGQNIQVASELKTGTKIKIKKSKEPEILIMHTHATECFLVENRDYYTDADLSRTTNNQKNVTAVGDALEQELKNAGFSVIHDKTQHDHPSYNGSYTRAKTTVQSYLKKYSSIKIVIDLHRDAMPSGNDKIAPTIEINKKKAAQVMLVMGSQTGTITGHANWKENLRLALLLQQDLEKKYPGFARSMLLKSAKYNQNLSTGSLLIEVGTDANTLDQALYSGQLVGKTLAETLNKLK